jgi:MFS family permease
MLGMLLIMLGNGLQSTLLGVRGSLEQIDPSSMGFIMSGYFIGFLGGSKLAPKMIKDVGHVRVFAALGSLVSAAFLLFSVWVEPLFWFSLRVIVGFCFAGIYVVAESWLNDISTNETRGKTLGFYLVMQMAGIVLGQVLLNVADPAGAGLFILISVLVSVSFAPILLSKNSAPPFDSAKPMTFLELFKASPLGVVGIFFIGTTFSALFGMSSVYATEINLSFQQISGFIMMIYIGGLIMQFPIGWLSDNMDRRLLSIIICFVGAATALSVFVLPSVPYVVLLGIAFMIGGACNPLYSVLIAHTNDYLENDQMASASGSLIFVNGVGAMGGPIIVGYLMKSIGPNGYHLFIALTLLIIGCYGLYRMTQRATIDTDELSPHVTIFNRSTSVMAQVAAEYVVDEMEAEGEEGAEDVSSDMSENATADVINKDNRLESDAEIKK